jgi:hypothetical protein
LPIVLYGCETWSLTLREEHRLKVFKNKLMRKISAPKRDNVTVERKRLHSEEIHDSSTHPILFGASKEE